MRFQIFYFYTQEYQVDLKKIFFSLHGKAYKIFLISVFIERILITQIHECFEGILV